jgi:DNA integrity scanning protein DisA with diadenylate cyclase activity
MDNLDQYIDTGVQMRAHVTPELLLQIFYPDTPLHDGAVIIAQGRIVAAACVMPLSASGILNRTPERQMGLRHRAALGISEVSDAVSVVVSEQSGSISISHAGRMIRRIDPERSKTSWWLIPSCCNRTPTALVSAIFSISTAKMINMRTICETSYVQYTFL